MDNNLKKNENGLDQFYTNKDISLKCYKKLKEIINLNDYNIHLEPSAGSGSFFNIMDDSKKNRIRYRTKRKWNL